MKRSSVGVFFFFPLLLLPRVMVVLQFYRDYEVFFVVVVVGGGVGGGVCTRLGRCRCSEHFLLLCRLKGTLSQKFLTSFRFHIFFIEIKMKKTLLIFFFCQKWMCRSLCLSFINSSKRIKEERRYSFVVER